MKESCAKWVAVSFIVWTKSRLLLCCINVHASVLSGQSMDINNKIKKSHTQFFSGMWVCWLLLPQLWSNLADKGLDIVYVGGRWGMRGLGLGVVIHVTLYIVHSNIVHQVLSAFFF